MVKADRTKGFSDGSDPLNVASIPSSTISSGLLMDITHH